MTQGCHADRINSRTADPCFLQMEACKKCQSFWHLLKCCGDFLGIPILSKFIHTYIYIESSKRVRAGCACVEGGGVELANISCELLGWYLISSGLK